MTRKTGKEVATEVSLFVNNFSPDTKGFIDAIMQDHKTIQQSVIRLCRELIFAMAQNKNVDARNVMCVNWCQEIVEKCSDFSHLPLI